MKKYNKAKIKNKISILSILLAVLVIILGVIVFLQKNKETFSLGEGETMMKEVSINLGEGIFITKIGSYSGKYIEDASDEEVSDILSIMVTNTSENTLQYAEIILTNGTEKAVFSVTTLKPNASMMVLESARMPYGKGYKEASIQNVVFFDEELSVYEGIFDIQPLDGGFNITNISQEDVEGDIMIYFKDCIDGIYCGGITYRGRIEGGLKYGEIRQVMTDNFSKSNTEVMFITIIEQ